MMLLPPTFDELISATHTVRVVNDVIDRIDLGPLLKEVYSGGGASVYHPRMMLKVLVYAYLSNIYSSRRMEAALCENIHFMWLSGMARPDHNTINRFRSHRVRDVMKQVFSEVVLMLMEAGHVDLKAVYTDGTKIGSTANRYTFVWAKTICTNREKMKKQLEELWAYSQQVAKEELADEQPPTWDRQPTPGLIFHSYRGVQYACNEFAELLKAYPKVRRSMSRKGNYWDNAVAESFFKTLKSECTDHLTGLNLKQTEMAVFEYIECWFNTNRRHSTLNYMTPLEYNNFLQTWKTVA